MRLLGVDDKRRALVWEVDELRARQNKASDEIAGADEGTRVQKIAEMKVAKEILRKKKRH